VRIFLGHVGFYRWVIKDFLKIAKPLTQLLVKDAPFEFDEEWLSAFNMLKEALISALVMQALDWGLQFEVMCDANDNKPYAIYYISWTLDKAQVNYVTIEKEFLAVVLTL